MLNYVLLASVATIGLAMAGIISSRHFAVMMLAVELILISSAVLLVSYFSLTPMAGADAFPMLIGVWSVAGAEAIALAAFYVYMKSRGLGLDLSKASATIVMRCQDRW
jgi:NADH:ubiquinone oxidoreductase subunit K